MARLSGALYRVGANLGGISMTRLGADVAILLIVEAGAEAAALQRQLDPVVHRFELRAYVDPLGAWTAAQAEANVRVTMHGADRPGIVAQVSAALSTAMDIVGLDSDVGGSADKPIYIYGHRRIRRGRCGGHGAGAGVGAPERHRGADDAYRAIRRMTVVLYYGPCLRLCCS